MQLKCHQVWYIHKYQTWQSYGGPEEGGWWYDSKATIPLDDPAYEPPLIFTDEEEAYEACRKLHAAEYERRDKGEYGYTSVLSYKERFYCYDVGTDSDPNSTEYISTHRPHYE